MGPTTIREVEDQVPTVDERGYRHVVIRTRKLETILGSVGPTEAERERRHTLQAKGTSFHSRTQSSRSFIITPSCIST
jgi:hypothetical protein